MGRCPLRILCSWLTLSQPFLPPWILRGAVVKLIQDVEYLSGAPYPGISSFGVCCPRNAKNDFCNCSASDLGWESMHVNIQGQDSGADYDVEDVRPVSGRARLGREHKSFM